MIFVEQQPTVTTGPKPPVELHGVMGTDRIWRARWHACPGADGYALVSRDHGLMAICERNEYAGKLNLPAGTHWLAVHAIYPDGISAPSRWVIQPITDGWYAA